MLGVENILLSSISSYMKYLMNIKFVVYAMKIFNFLAVCNIRLNIFPMNFKILVIGNY